jgi:hypothetical protein
MPVRRMTWWATTGLVAAGLAGCGTTVTGAGNTGLSGTALRGPVTPVCYDDVPCEVGFGASFTVYRGGRAVTTFTSDSTGAFRVSLAPGSYQIVPGADAPIIDPTAQSRSVTVADGGWTSVELHFDTGLR